MAFNIAIIILWLTVVFGWILNLLALFELAQTSCAGFSCIGLMEVLRLIGIFVFPLGSLIGYLF